MSDYADAMFVRFVAEFDRLQRERKSVWRFADLPPVWQEGLKAAFLRTAQQIQDDLY